MSNKTDNPASQHEHRFKGHQLRVMSGQRVELERELLRTLTMDQDQARFEQLLRRLTPAANSDLTLAHKRKDEP